MIRCIIFISYVLVLFTASAQSLSNSESYDEANGSSYTSEYEDLLIYLAKLGVNLDSTDYRYVLLYPWKNQKYSDHHWDHFFQSGISFKSILVVFVLNDPMLERDFVKLNLTYGISDVKNLYKKQCFYSYTPILYEIDNAEIIKKTWMSVFKALPVKASLWQKLK